MIDTIKLTKILLKNSMNKLKEKNFGTTILLFLAIAYVVGVMAYMSYNFINVLKEIHQEQVFINVILLICLVMTLMRTIFSALNVLYFSKDIEFLLPLPIKPLQIILAKFNTMLVSNFLTIAITFGVPLGTYGIMIKCGFSYFINMLLVLAFMPIIPMILGIVLVILLMNITKVFRNKNFIQYVSVFITLIIIFGMQVFINKNSEITDFMIANKLLEINGISNMISKYIFILDQSMKIIFATNIKEFLLNLFYIVIESLVIYFISAMLLAKVYIKTALSITTNVSFKTKTNLKKTKKSSLLKTYVSKEFKLLFRNPIFLMQCVLPSILVPLIMSYPLYDSFIKSSTMETKALISTIFDTIHTSMGFGILLMIIDFSFLFCAVSVTAISREGSSALFMKYIPVKLSTQMKYKTIPNFIINFIPLIYICVILKILFPSLELWFYAEVLVVAIISNMFISYLSAFIDIQRPKLQWSSENSVVKQNANMLFELLLELFLIALILVLSAYIENIKWLVILLSTIMCLILIVYELFLENYSRQIFKNIS